MLKSIIIIFFISSITAFAQALGPGPDSKEGFGIDIINKGLRPGADSLLYIIPEVDSLPSFSIKELLDSIDYPQDDMCSGVEGEVVLRALIGSDGSLLKVIAEQMETRAMGEAALAAVRRITFRQAMYRDKPLQCPLKIIIPFYIRNFAIYTNSAPVDTRSKSSIRLGDAVDIVINDGDIAIDLRLNIGNNVQPVGLEYALIGMKTGQKARITVPEKYNCGLNPHPIFPDRGPLDLQVEIINIYR